MSGTRAATGESDRRASRSPLSARIIARPIYLALPPPQNAHPRSFVMLSSEIGLNGRAYPTPLPRLPLSLAVRSTSVTSILSPLSYKSPVIPIVRFHHFAVSNGPAHPQ